MLRAPIIFKRARPRIWQLIQHCAGAALIAFLLIITAPDADAATGEYSCGSFACESVNIDSKDLPSLQRGARLYVNYCLGCHSMKHARYERMADDLKLPHELVVEHLITDGSKIGGHILTALPEKHAKAWFGVVPPDLSLITRAKDPDWVYAFLRSFYADDDKPWGVNNRVSPGVAMPHVLEELQGLQKCTLGPVITPNNGVKRDPVTGEDILGTPCGSFTLSEKGQLSAEEFDSAMRDLVNFMTYVAEPFIDQRIRIGIYVELFLLVLLVFTWLLKREYWRGIH